MAKYSGTVYLYWKGKNYGATTRLVGGVRNKMEARRKLKKMMAFKQGNRSNVVRVKNIIRRSKK